MHALRVVALAVALSSAAIACVPAPTADQTTALNALNADRKANKVPALTEDATLDTKATNWAAYLRDRCALSHSKLTDGLGGLNWVGVAENVGYGSSIGVVEQTFMASAPHRKNIVNPAYQIVGLGVARGTCNGTARTFVVQVFVDLA